MGLNCSLDESIESNNNKNKKELTFNIQDYDINEEEDISKAIALSLSQDNLLSSNSYQSYNDNYKYQSKSSTTNNINNSNNDKSNYTKEAYDVASHYLNKTEYCNKVYLCQKNLEYLLSYNDPMLTGDILDSFHSIIFSYQKLYYLCSLDLYKITTSKNMREIKDIKFIHANKIYFLLFLDHGAGHWIAGFVDTIVFTITYCDSAGKDRSNNSELKKLCNYYSTNGYGEFKKWRIIADRLHGTKLMKQRDNVNCGTFAAYFLFLKSNYLADTTFKPSDPIEFKKFIHNLIRSKMLTIN